MIMAFAFSSYGQTQKQKEKITSRYNTSEIAKLQRQFTENAQKQKQEALKAAQLNNWPLVIQEEGKYAELQRIAEDGSPVYYTTFNVDAARSTRTDHLNIGGSLGLSLDGQKMTAHVWDGGLARTTHPGRYF